MKKRTGLWKFLAGLTRFIAILLVACAMSLALLLIAQRIFSPFHVVVSNSMFPQIKTGDAVVVKDIDPAAVQIGQIVIFHDPEDKSNYVIHRVISVEDVGGVKFYSTRGDHNDVPDNWKISQGEVVGGVAVTLPGFGAFLDFVSTAKGYVSFIVIPALASLVIVMLLGLIEKLTALSKRNEPSVQVPPTAT
jgi:signal peptidase I